MPIDIARVQAICFDVDGTLRDTDDQWVERAVSLFFHPLRFLMPHTDLQAAARRAVMAIEDPGNLALHWIDRLGLDDLAVQVAHRLPPRRLSVGKAPGAIPGVLEALKTLQARYLLAVVSARGQEATLRFLDGNGLTPLFRVVATGQTTHHTKPFPDPILWAAGQMGVPASACLMVGDTTVDMRAGRAAGCQNVGVLCGFGKQAELTRAGADLILPSTADLPGIFV